MINYLFNFLTTDSRQRFKIIIGQELGRLVKFKNEKNQFISIDELNLIDRESISKEFIKKRTYNGKYRIDTFYDTIYDYSDDELLKNVSEYIDFILPRRYFIDKKLFDSKFKLEKDSIRKEYKGIDTVKGAVYVYDDNYIRDREFYKITDDAYYYNVLSDKELYTILKEECENFGYNLEKTQSNMKRIDMINLLQFLIKDEEMDNESDFINYE